MGAAFVALPAIKANNAREHRAAPVAVRATFGAFVPPTPPVALCASDVACRGIEVPIVGEIPPATAPTATLLVTLKLNVQV